MKAGKYLENYVQFVYQKLLEFMDEGAIVSSNVSVIGKSGVKHVFHVLKDNSRTHNNLLIQPVYL